jgi:hypothetical protein
MEWRCGGVAVAGTDCGAGLLTGVPEKGPGLSVSQAAGRSRHGVTALIVCKLVLRLQGPIEEMNKAVDCVESR